MGNAAAVGDSAAAVYGRSELVISREQGLHYGAGFAVPVLMS